MAVLGLPNVSRCLKRQHSGPPTGDPIYLRISRDLTAPPYRGASSVKLLRSGRFSSPAWSPSWTCRYRAQHARRQRDVGLFGGLWLLLRRRHASGHCLVTAKMAAGGLMLKTAM